MGDVEMSSSARGPMSLREQAAVKDTRNVKADALKWLISMPVQGTLILFTLFVLYMDDIRLMALPKSADDGVDFTYFAIFLVFFAEICFNYWLQDDYDYKNFYFWLDVIATGSLIPYIPWVRSAVTGAQVGNTARISRAGRAIRLARIGRAATVATKLAKAVTAVKLVKQGAFIIKNTAHPKTIAIQMADKILRKIVLGFLLLMVVITFAAVEQTDEAPVYALRTIVEGAGFGQGGTQENIGEWNFLSAGDLKSMVNATVQQANNYFNKDYDTGLYKTDPVLIFLQILNDYAVGASNYKTITGVNDAGVLLTESSGFGNNRVNMPSEVDALRDEEKIEFDCGYDGGNDDCKKGRGKLIVSIKSRVVEESALRMILTSVIVVLLLLGVYFIFVDSFTILNEYKLVKRNDPTKQSFLDPTKGATEKLSGV